MAIHKYQDDAQVSINKGKKPAVCSYHRQRFAKTGVSSEYWGRVLSPLGSQFSFTAVADHRISITPIKDIPDSRITKTILTMQREGCINPNECYVNSFLIALHLKKYNIDIQCVEGYYRTRNGWFRHRFNKYNGVYFDATGEFFVSTPLDEIEYHAYRLYSPDEILAISAAFSFLRNKPFKLHFSSTLQYDSRYFNTLDIDEVNEYYLDDSGAVCIQDNYE